MKVEIPAKLIPVFQGPARYRGAFGGRGSAKSVSFAKMFLLRGRERPRRLLGGREFQNSIKDSVHAELCKQVHLLGLGDFYDCQDKTIVGKNGTQIIYRGFWNNINSIRSLTDIDIAWIEEAEYLSERSWEVLVPTIRNPGSEIWATWNPEREDSPTKKRLLDNPSANTKTVEVNWRDNPWFPPVLHEERLDLLRRDPDAYQHVWEGKCITRTDAQVFAGKWVVDEFTPGPDWDGPYFGADWGFSADPNTLIKCWIYGRNLLIQAEAYGLRTEIKDIKHLFDTVEGARKHKIYADCSRPETISHVRADGFNIVAAEKWPGSVEDGLEVMRGSFDKIIIHPDCTHTINEMTLYSYKVDRLTGDVLPVIIDKNNHCIDAIRYAIGKFIKRKPQGFFGRRTRPA